jgi:hypothetical protein
MTAGDASREALLPCCPPDAPDLEREGRAILAARASGLSWEQIAGTLGLPLDFAAALAERLQAIARERRSP